MSTAERTYQEVRNLPEEEAWKVLDFIAYLKSRREQQSDEQNTTVFDRFGAVYTGTFNR